MKPETMDKMLKLIRTADRDELDRMGAALAARRSEEREARAHTTLRTIKNGDRVRLINLKPQYLIGAEGIVIGRKGSKFRVEFAAGVDPRALRRFGPAPFCPPGMLEKVGD